MAANAPGGLRSGEDRHDRISLMPPHEFSLLENAPTWRQALGESKARLVRKWASVTVAVRSAPPRACPSAA